MKWIDLRSDTVTKPTQSMRKAMAEAEVGDDVYEDDPTTNRLQQVAAAMTGKQAALFTCSGTMGNLLGVMSQTHRSDEVILGARSHIITHEVGHLAQICQCMARTIDHPDDMIWPQDIAAAVRNQDIHEPVTSLLCLENALSSGTVVPLDHMQKTYEAAKQAGLSVHLDGARIFNAATALRVTVKELAACTDTMTFCLSKGLCAPVGSILVGSKEVIDRARKNRKKIGGGMRQTGILAAAGLIALEEMTLRLDEDHQNAKELARLLNQIDWIHVIEEQLDINMIFFRCHLPSDKLAQLPELLKKEGILINGEDHGILRLVTHQQVEKTDLPRIVEAFMKVGRE